MVIEWLYSDLYIIELNLGKHLISLIIYINEESL